MTVFRWHLWEQDARCSRYEGAFATAPAARCRVLLVEPPDGRYPRFSMGPLAPITYTQLGPKGNPAARRRPGNTHAPPHLRGSTLWHARKRARTITIIPLRNFELRIAFSPQVYNVTLRAEGRQ